MAAVHPTQTALVLRPAGKKGNTSLFNGGAYFHRAPSATAVVLPMADGQSAHGWLVETWTARNNQLHHTIVDGNGRVLDIESRTANDSYNIFPVDPGKGAQTVIAGPGAGNDVVAGRLARQRRTVDDQYRRQQRERVSRHHRERPTRQGRHPGDDRQFPGHGGPDGRADRRRQQ